MGKIKIILFALTIGAICGYIGVFLDSILGDFGTVMFCTTFAMAGIVCFLYWDLRRAIERIEQNMITKKEDKVDVTDEAGVW